GLEGHQLGDDAMGPDWDLGARYAASYANGFQHLGYDSLTASGKGAFGWGSPETQSAFMVVLILVGALGIFAAVRVITRSRTWAAALAGLLFAGPLAYQLFVDSSEGALAGLA